MFVLSVCLDWVFICSTFQSVLLLQPRPQQVLFGCSVGAAEAQPWAGQSLDCALDKGQTPTPGETELSLQKDRESQKQRG